MRKYFFVAAFAIFFFHAHVISRSESGEIKTMNPAEVHQALLADSTIILLDVRTSEEYTSETGHLANARLIPVQELEKHLAELDSLKHFRFVIYCRSGRRSAQACTLLSARGFQVSNLEGGIIRWRNEGFPVVETVK